VAETAVFASYFLYPRYLTYYNFASFFTDKISKLHLSLDSNHTMSSTHSPSPSTTPPDFSAFNPASESEIHKFSYIRQVALMCLMGGHVAITC